MELLERYLFAVSERLPRNMREDVTTELRSLLMDMIEAEAGTKAEKADEAAVVTVLQQFGSPQEVAESYQPRPQYLIGPDFYPTYIMVLRIVWIVVSVVFAITTVVSLLNSEQIWLNLGNLFLDLVPDYLWSLVTSLGSVTVIFVLIERFAPETADSIQADEGEEADWDPRQLAPIDDPNRISRSDAIAEIVATIIVMVLVNSFLRDYAVPIYNGSEWQSLPILSESFLNAVLPWLNLFWISQIVFNVYLLRLQRWNKRARWCDIGLNVLDLVVTAIIFVSLPIFDIDAARLAAAGWEQSDSLIVAFNTLIPFVNQMIRIGIVIYFVWLIFSLGKRLFDMFRWDHTSTVAAVM